MTELNNNTTNRNTSLDLINSILKVPGSVLSNLLDNSFDKKNTRKINQYQEIAHRIINLRQDFICMSDEELKNQTDIIRNMIRENAPENDILTRAFATAREAARRTLMEEPYPVQIIGGIGIHKGNIIEMKTGEGKTLTGMMPAYLNALYDRGVHIITVNDYLAKRDALWMKPVFDLLNISVGYITAEKSRSERKHAYHCDITYCTNNEIVFDYLKDNMTQSTSDITHRIDDLGYPILNFALIDEADSILIDAKRMPLIISGQTDDHIDYSLDENVNQNKNRYLIANQVVEKIKKMHADKHPCYEIKKKEQQVLLNDMGFDAVESSLKEQEYLLASESLYHPKHSDMLHKINQALRAHFLYIKGKEYILTRSNHESSEEICQIIDEHTGRVMYGRRYSHGLHQAIEAKEGIAIQPETSTLASATFHNYFCEYTKLAGMTGTAITEEEEFNTAYNLNCVKIPSNVSSKRFDYDDMMYLTKYDKINGIIDAVKNCYKKGQPVIIGTTNVDNSNDIGERLIYEFQQDAELKKIYNTNKAIYQLGQFPGIKILNAVNHAQEAEIISKAGRMYAVTVVTNMAGRGTDIKLGGDPKFILRSIQNNSESNLSQTDIDLIADDVKRNKQAVENVGGLMIIGSEHNNNRRIDNQLRGRAGRQGEPGATIFYLSTEDEIIKSFNPNMTNLMRSFGVSDNETLEHPWLTNAIVDSQRRLEAFYFEERQMMQKYANIREEYIKIFYKNRVHVLNERFKDFIESACMYLDILYLKNIVLMFDTEDLIREIQTDKTALIKRLCQYVIEQTSDENNALTAVFKSQLLRTIDKSIIDFNLDIEHIRDMVSLQTYIQKDQLIMYYEQCNELFIQIQRNIMTKFISDMQVYLQQLSENDQ